MEIDTAARITRWRQHKGKSLTACAEAMGLHKSGLSRIESGRQRVTSDQLEKLAEFLGITLAEFYGKVPQTKRVAVAR